MTNARLHEIVQEILASVPRDSATITFVESPDEGEVLIGNRDGLIRLAGELFHVAECQIPFPGADVEYLLSTDSGGICRVGYTETLSESRPSGLAGWKTGFVKLVGLIVALLLFVCTIVGAVTIISRW